MAGVGARDIKRKIKSISSTKQITKAMELVSTAKLKKSKEKMEKFRPFFFEILNSLSDIMDRVISEKNLFDKRSEIKNSLIVVITSDRGLCGGYNTNAIKKAESAIAGKKSAKIVTIGKRATDYFKKRNYDVVKSYSGVSEVVSYSFVKALAEDIIQMYLCGEVDEIELVYTQMISAINQKATLMGLIPIDLSEYATEEELENARKDVDKIQYLPSLEDVIEHLVPKYIASVVHGAMIESAAAEQSARRNAMENASNNAQEMIDTLTLSFNQARQGAITQELTEIVGGANALEG